MCVCVCVCVCVSSFFVADSLSAVISPMLGMPRHNQVNVCVCVCVCVCGFFSCNALPVCSDQPGAGHAPPQPGKCVFLCVCVCVCVCVSSFLVTDSLSAAISPMLGMPHPTTSCLCAIKVCVCVCVGRG